MVPGIFREFADEINAEISKNVSKNTREIAKKMKSKNMPVKEIIEFTGLTEEEVKAL
jgi:predicted transposase YdaD